ncbi:MAG: hypothetical protein INR66_17940 [Gordonia polyisoprenivorans]|nr:hypothetical protein [Gordonia polyisoprenivorans]
MSSKTNLATFHIVLPEHLHGPELSERIKKAVREEAGRAGAVSTGDVSVTGSIPHDDRTVEHTVRVRLYFGGPAFG